MIRPFLQPKLLIQPISVDVGSRDKPTLQEQRIYLLVTLLPVGMNHNVKEGCV